MLILLIFKSFGWRWAHRWNNRFLSPTLIAILVDLLNKSRQKTVSYHRRPPWFTRWVWYQNQWLKRAVSLNVECLLTVLAPVLKESSDGGYQVCDGKCVWFCEHRSRMRDCSQLILSLWRMPSLKVCGHRRNTQRWPKSFSYYLCCRKQDIGQVHEATRNFILMYVAFQRMRGGRARR